MADYYPLISRAVAGLEKNNGENRRALYERARAALIAQLRGVTPALPESDITRERLALEESIRKVEAEAARQFDASRGQSTARPRPGEVPSRGEERTPAHTAPPRQSGAAAPRQRPPEPERWEDAPPLAAPPSRPAAPYPGRGEMPAALRRPVLPQSAPAMPSARDSGTIFDHPMSPESPPASPPRPAPPRHPLRRPLVERRSAAEDIRDVVSEANELGDASARAAQSARDAYAATVPSSDERREPRMFDRGQERNLRQLPTEFDEPMLEPSFSDEEARPVSPRSRQAPVAPDDDLGQRQGALRPRRSYRELIKGAAVIAVVAVLGGALLAGWPYAVALYQKFRTPQVAEVRNPPAQASRTKIADRIEPGVQPSQQSAAPTSPGVAPGAAVAQKVVLYEEDPADPNGKRFVGSAIWRTETISPGPGQPPELAIRADVDVPDRKMAMTWSLRRNTDKSLPASHTVEITFKLPPDFPSGGISNVPGILMKQAEQTRGVPLAGLAVKVTTGFFLIGLSASDADRDRNLQLLKERAWFDIPVVYNNNRRAILAIEKGTPGDRVFAEAFKVWNQ